MEDISRHLGIVGQPGWMVLMACQLTSLISTHGQTYKTMHYMYMYIWIHLNFHACKHVHPDTLSCARTQAHTYTMLHFFCILAIIFTSWNCDFYLHFLNNRKSMLLCSVWFAIRRYFFESCFLSSLACF